MKNFNDGQISPNQGNKSQPNFQFQLAVIEREVDDSHIHQRLLDGYINATALCKACGKNLADYARLKTTKEFLEELSSDMGIQIGRAHV